MANSQHWYGIILVAAALAVLNILSACTKSKSSDDKGILSGVVSIGPLCPVERNPPDPACLPTAETYKAWPVGIWSIDGKKKIAAISPALKGSYQTEICPGTYQVKLEIDQPHAGNSNLPAEITITAGDTTKLDIDIDTGIR